MKKYLLEIVVFITGAVVMALEIVGSRVLAPYVGTSIVVWTSLIGVILASLSLGYWLGGRIADKNPHYKPLARIILFAGVLIGLVSFTKSFLLSTIGDYFSDLRMASIVATLLLFAPPSLFLGMVLPYAVRLKLRSLKKSGRTSGNLFALSTIGSILGTFSAGFFLLAYLGNTKILMLLSIFLIGTSFLVYPGSVLGIKSKILLFLVTAITVFGLLNLPDIGKQGTFLDTDTLYNRVILEVRQDETTGRQILALVLGNADQSFMFLDKDDDLAAEYTKYYRLGTHFNPNIKHALMIGGGGYSYPKDFLKTNPDAHLDVVEIDPKITELARKYFRLEDNPRLAIYHQDARDFLNKTEKKYDAIFIDVYEGDRATPFQITTFEAVSKIYDILNKSGVVILNIGPSIEGESGRFLRAELKTYEAIFPQVYVFPVADPEDGARRQNIIFIALKSENTPVLSSKDEKLRRYLKNLFTKEITKDMPILTDDYAPIEWYTMRVGLD